MSETLEKAKKYASNIQYDFRLGLDLDKIIYRDRRVCNCREITIYIVILIAYWILVCGYYALWHHFYLGYMQISFWVLVSCTGALVIIWFSTTLKSYMEYKARKEEKERKRLEAKQEEEEVKEKKIAALNTIVTEVGGDAQIGEDRANIMTTNPNGEDRKLV